MFGFHGFYEEEHVLGNYFIVNIKVGFPSEQQAFSLEDTVNYEVLLEIVTTLFSKPVLLLEELVQKIASETKKKYPYITYLLVSLKKNNPPLGAEVESSEVSVEERFEN